jgi:hypothetical protein
MLEESVRVFLMNNEVVRGFRVRRGVLCLLVLMLVVLSLGVGLLLLLRR